MSVLRLIDNEAAELRFAMAYYWKGGNLKEARHCYHELLGLRRARSIVERAADRMERAA